MKISGTGPSNRNTRRSLGSQHAGILIVTFSFLWDLRDGPILAGTWVCHIHAGATNWLSSSYHECKGQRCVL